MIGKPSRSSRGLALPFVAILVLAAGALPADEIELKNGGKVEGKIVEKTATVVKIETRMGVVTLPRDRIARIIYKKTPAEEFAERLKKADPKDASVLMALGDWARKKGLRREAAEAYRRVVAVEPDHAGARKALGHVKFDGRWMTKKEAAAEKAALDAASKRAEGMVRYEGKWVTREEKEAREKGWVRHEGKWMPVEEANRAKGLVRVGGEWVRREIADLKKTAVEYEALTKVKFFLGASKHFRVLSVFDQEHADQVALAAEKALGIVRDRLGYRGKLLTPEEPLTSFLFRRPGPYALVAERVGKASKQNADWIKYAQRSDSFVCTSPPYVTCDHLALRKQPQLVHGVVYKLGSFFLSQMHFKVSLPPNWVCAGFQSWLEIETLGECLNTPLAIGYGTTESKGDRWSRSETWKPMLRDVVQARGDKPLEQLMGAHMNELGRTDLVKCWSLVEWMIARKRDAFHAYLRDVRQRYADLGQPGTLSPSEMRGADRAAFEKAFGETVGAVEEAWRTYVSASY